MSLIVQRTNPDAYQSATGRRWRCPACRTSYPDRGSATTCAEVDHTTGRHKIPTAPAYDINRPPCEDAA